MMGRTPRRDKNELNKGPWTPEEDRKLRDFIQKYGHRSWIALPALAGLNRCGKSCRLRWTNYLRPDIKRGNFTEDEEKLIILLHSQLGNKWARIATHLPGRTDNEIKNYWNTKLKKQLLQTGIDPVTHQPITETLDILANLPQLLAMASSVTNPSFLNTNISATGLQPDATQISRNLQNVLQVLSSNTSTKPQPLDPLAALLGNNCSLSADQVQKYLKPNTEYLQNLHRSLGSDLHDPFLYLSGNFTSSSYPNASLNLQYGLQYGSSNTSNFDHGLVESYNAFNDNLYSCSLLPSDPSYLELAPPEVASFSDSHNPGCEVGVQSGYNGSIEQTDHHLSNSTTLDALENLLEDEASASYW